MPAKLSIHPEDESVLVLKLGGSSEEFRAQLARAKTVPGRRYNAAEKTWEFPNTPDVLFKVVNTIEPTLDDDLKDRVETAQQEAAEEIITHLPDDAALVVPWHDRLAPKQRSGVDFLAEHPHALLADDMGAGKTAQSISAVYEHHWRKNEAPTDGGGPKLVVAPASVLSHWRRELAKWAGVPAEATLIVGEQNVKDAKGKADRATEIRDFLAGGGEWVLINWEKLQARFKLVGETKAKPKVLDKIKWDAILADEAHRAKSRKSQQARGLYKLQAPMQLAITGTPVMNNPGELWSLLHWLDRKTYTSYWNFFHTYTEFYEGYQGRPVVIGVKNPDALRFELADKMVRRTKREIHPTMQKPFDPIIYEPEMTTAQQKVYDQATKEFWLDIARDEPEAAGALVGSGDLAALRLAIPTAATRVLRLRQVATSPAVLEVDGESPPDSSGKLDSVVEVLSQDERPWVMFTWFKASAELLTARLRSAGLTAETFTGKDDKEERTRLADDFQAGEFQVIVATISVGGVGINLHRAADCGFVEEDWVPEINNQAFARVDRMGQEQRPQRHIWRTANSVDTGRIAPTNATKALITKTLMGGE